MNFSFSFSFNDIYISRDLKFSIGIEKEMKRYYISFLIPTANRQSDYEVYYWLSENYFEFIYSNPEKIYLYVLECREGRHKEMEVNLS